MGHICLNCNTEITLNFCPKCGQKTSVHRYSLDHFLKHDVVHGVWHVDNSLPKTIIQLFSTPGHSVREYLNGRRTRLFNFISLLILLLAASSFLTPYLTVKMSDLLGTSTSKKAMEILQDYIKNYPKTYMMITIPLYSLFSLWTFRKAKLNFSEHMVLNSYKSCGDLLISLCFSVLTIFYTDIQGLKNVYFYILMPALILYGAWFFYQFFSTYNYTKKGLLWRSIMPYIYLNVVVAILSVIGGILYMYFRNR